MKGNRELDDLLISYILEELNAEDEAFVLDYIRRDESNRQHYEELRKTWRAIMIKKGLDKVNTDDEWEVFEQRIAMENPNLIVVKPEAARKVGGVEEEMEEVEEKVEVEGGRKRRVVRKIFVSVAIAASLLVVIVSGWGLFLRKEKTSETVSGSVAAKTDEVKPRLKRISNSSGKPERLLLPDGSEVILANKSEISYAEQFTAAKRDVFLEGKADFAVAQDKQRPFTVYSFDLATTVLGTVFTVSAFEHAENIIIKLNSGKVVVRSTKKGSMGLKQDYYLLPGQQLIYNNRNYTAKLLDGNKKKGGSISADRNEEAYTEIPDIPENNKGSWYMFNNESLEQVFDQLKLLYNTDIVYAKKDVHNLYFAGRFERSDSLYTILSQIASVNNLKVHKRDNKYIIAKE